MATLNVSHTFYRHWRYRKEKCTLCLYKENGWKKCANIFLNKNRYYPFSNEMAFQLGSSFNKKYFKTAKVCHKVRFFLALQTKEAKLCRKREESENYVLSHCINDLFSKSLFEGLVQSETFSKAVALGIQFELVQPLKVTRARIKKKAF